MFASYCYDSTLRDELLFHRKRQGLVVLDMKGSIYRAVALAALSIVCVGPGLSFVPARNCGIGSARARLCVGGSSRCRLFPWRLY